MSFRKTILLVVFVAISVIVLLRNFGIASSAFSVLAILPHYDKIGHFLIMGILSATAVFAFSGVNLPSVRRAALSMGGVLLVVGVEELSQHWLTNRTASWADFAADLFGVLSGGILMYLSLRRVRNQQRATRLSVRSETKQETQELRFR